jgi:ABC-type sugar transport system permease subunit
MIFFAEFFWSVNYSVWYSSQNLSGQYIIQYDILLRICLVSKLFSMIFFSEFVWSVNYSVWYSFQNLSAQVTYSVYSSQNLSGQYIIQLIFFSEFVWSVYYSVDAWSKFWNDNIGKTLNLPDKMLCVLIPWGLAKKTSYRWVFHGN